ncbi:hypothetical protein [Botrimarina mediterranea]|uniref:Uncharacterized protein n=1 Tax=Botrimarina mediterranea TaxID=2528022 RepID=A0A518K3U3_9BACT|nr:hypothetical protein [Botrimarina mediterranea]QDV72474.1 hypothetical protein Spa11_06520 [Botrimarina mediterranea]QDV77044.1 hypothetical protein K2D_06310 [Planctomycetes bacterium K2D]
MASQTWKEIQGRTIEQQIHDLDEAVAEAYGWVFHHRDHEAAPLMRKFALEWDIELQNLKAEVGRFDY